MALVRTGAGGRAEKGACGSGTREQAGARAGARRGSVAGGSRCKRRRARAQAGAGRGSLTAGCTCGHARAPGAVARRGQHVRAGAGGQLSLSLFPHPSPEKYRVNKQLRVIVFSVTLSSFSVSCTPKCLMNCLCSGEVALV
uniref:Uncharacterized protein n=1 Tax=Ananas comosus var. bracteatus TaxID=296719 RepID=A0A6V7PHK6_ANACO|nr:unnamed protein product [Ananas comosus var. bracteatus]